MECHSNCGHCCVLLNITTPILGHPNGKKIGERCVNLDETNRCSIHGTSKYPAVCAGFLAEKDFCGDNEQEAKEILTDLVAPYRE